jgi:threonine/homoserine/homoserine lactone efflux protein
MIAKDRLDTVEYAFPATVMSLRYVEVSAIVQAVVAVVTGLCFVGFVRRDLRHREWRDAIVEALMGVVLLGVGIALAWAVGTS